MSLKRIFHLEEEELVKVKDICVKRVKSYKSLHVDIPSSNFKLCCGLNKCACFDSVLDSISDVFCRKVFESRRDYAHIPTTQHILGYSRPGEYEGLIVDYYYENEHKPPEKQRQCLPFDLLSKRQFECILNM